MIPEGTTEGTAEGQQADGSPKVDKHKLTIDGEEREYTVDELKALASESAGAQKKFQEAADARKGLEELEELQQMLKDPGFSAAVNKAYQQAVGGGEESGDYGGEGDDAPVTAADVKKMLVEQHNAIRADLQLEGDLKDLKADVGEFDEKELLKFCDKEGIFNVKAGYKAWKFDELMEKGKKAKEAEVLESLKGKRKHAEAKPMVKPAEKEKLPETEEELVAAVREAQARGDLLE